MPQYKAPVALPTPIPASKTFETYCREASEAFLDEHLVLGQKKLHQVQHLLIYLNGDLILLKKVSDETYEQIAKSTTPAKERPYLLIKTISHYVVRLHMILNAMRQKELPTAQGIERLRLLREHLHTFTHLYTDIVKDEMPVIELTESLITNIVSIVADQKQIQPLYARYMTEMQVHHERYGRQATEHQLRGLESITSQWLVDYAIDLKSTYILIVGARAPKKDLIERQYFDVLRKRHGVCVANTPSSGILYAEMLPAHMENLSVSDLVRELAGDLQNQTVGEEMLDDRKAMFKDVLGRHANPVLAEMGNPQDDQPQPSKCPFHR